MDASRDRVRRIDKLLLMVRSAAIAARLEPWARNTSGSASAALVLRDALAARGLLRMRADQA
jgi:hypothetical protein